MRFLSKKIYIIFFLLATLLIESPVLARESSTQYKKRDISNYFSGIIAIKQDHDNNKALEHFGKIQSINNNRHSQYDIEFIRTLVLLDKFKQAYAYSKNIWDEDELFFEADLLLGLKSFIKKDYKRAEKHFERLNKISLYNLIFDDFFGNVLIAWVRASQGNEKDAYKFINKIPKPYNHLKRTQNIFLQCYFDSPNTQKSLEKLIENKNYNFSRYNFFLANYLLSKNKIEEAKEVIQNSRKKYSSNLLIKQTEFSFLNNKIERIRNVFDCKNPKDSLAEFFYVMSNIYSGEREFRLSNFYLKISLFLNNKFLPNKTLLAENFYYQKKFEEAKNIYKSTKSIGSIYSWHASKNIATILLKEKGKKYSVNNLQKDFNLISNKNFEHYFELANFYKDNEYFEESIKYYSLALEKIEKDHFLVSKIFDRRGTSFERSGDWESAEKDLLESLKILPDQAHVLNYLAYTWVDRGINLDRGLEMLIKANELRENDGYIIDSLGWAYYAKKNYVKAKFFLQKAVELLPSDPIISDHYADSLWMLDKKIQARYIWRNILQLEGTEEKLKDSIKKKLVFGITKQL